MPTSPAITELASPPALGLRVAGEPLRAPALRRGFEPKWWFRGRLILDTVVLTLATVVAVFGANGRNADVTANWIAAAFPVIVLVLMYARRSPEDRLTQSVVDTISHVVGSVSLAAMVTIAIESIVGADHPVAVTLRLWVLTLVYLSVARVVLRSVRRKAFASRAFSTPTLIVGAGVIGQKLVERLLSDRTYGLRPVGLIDAAPLPFREHSLPAELPVMGGIENLMEAIHMTGARQLVLAFSSDPDSMIIEKIEECRRMGVSVLMVPRLYELINERSTLDHVGGLPVVALRSTNPRSIEFAIKHAFDRVFAAVTLLILAPVMLTVALLVRTSSPGPVLFRQRRVGRDGRQFDLLKFRSMSCERPGSGFQPKDGCAPGGVEGADRRTKFGRFLRKSSLDELPQLINVLRGEMSIVGPRPERPVYVERFVSEVDRYDRRHRVKSGITGWAQVRGLRGQTSISDRVEWDNFYIQNWSLWLDLKILALTFAEVVRFRG